VLLATKGGKLVVNAPVGALTPLHRDLLVLLKPQLLAILEANLPPELYEQWQERVCIMHYDGRLPWAEAERLALKDVLGRKGNCK
jgi:hypothetical protein